MTRLLDHQCNSSPARPRDNALIQSRSIHMGDLQACGVSNDQRALTLEKLIRRTETMMAVGGVK